MRYDETTYESCFDPSWLFADLFNAISCYLGNLLYRALSTLGNTDFVLFDYRTGSQPRYANPGGQAPQ